MKSKYELFRIKIERGSSRDYNSLLVLFKLLLGTLLIEFEDGSEIKSADVLSQIFKIDMSCDTFDENEEENISIKDRYKNSLIDEYFDKDSSTSLLENHYNSNRNFYDDLLNEVLDFYYYQSRESYFSAFIHLYRIYEYISYTFPLIFITKSVNYSESYKELQSFFSGKGEELAFFRVFMQKTFLLDDYIYSELYKESYEISLSKSGVNLFKNELNTFINRFNNNKNKKNTNFINSLDSQVDVRDKTTFLDENSSKLIISTLDVNDFFIELRNKTCHYKMNHSDSVSLFAHRFDDLYEILNPVFLNWIANIFKFVLFSSTHG